MPEKGRKGITIYQETFDLFNHFYEENREELRARNIASVSSLIIECALRGLDGVKLLVDEKRSGENSREE